MKALLLENIHPDASRILTEAGYEVETHVGSLSESDLISALDGVTLLGIRSNTQVNLAVLDAAAASLEAIGAFCIGTNQIALKEAARHGIGVFNAPYSNTRSVVELAVGEIIALSRHLTDKNSKTHNGIWNKSDLGSHEVRGRTLGIIGYGSIGSQLSILAEAFGMHVYFYDIVDRLALGNAQRCHSLDDLLERSETISIHVDGRASNKGFFGAEQFAKMRKGSLFLNLSRGNVIDQIALAENLKSGHLAGAAVDVFPREPKTVGDSFTNVLQGIDNVILTPHIGGSTQEAQIDIGRFVAEKLAAYRRTGVTSMSVNLPEVAAGEMLGKRILNIHHNVPGVMASLNQLLSKNEANIIYQALATRGDVGYAITDVSDDIPGLLDEIEALPASIRTRIL